MEIGNSFSGALSRDQGEAVNTYLINIGTLKDDSGNFNLQFSATPVYFAITPKTLTITPVGTYTYNGSAQTITLNITGIVNGEDVSASIDPIKDAGTASHSVTLTGTAKNNYRADDVLVTMNKFQLTFGQVNTPTYTTQAQKINLNANYQGTDGQNAATWDLHVMKTNVASENLNIQNLGNIPNDIAKNYNIPTTFNAEMNPANINDIVIGVTLGTLEEDYTDNSVKSKDFTAIVGNLELTLNGNTISKDGFTFVHYNFNSTTPLTNISLANGGTTHIIRSNIATYNNPNFTGTYTKTIDQVSTNVTYKFKSVTIGNNTTYYTIEDALRSDASGTRIVKYNTSFADSAVQQQLYKTTTFNVASGVTLLLPWDANYLTEPNKGGTGAAKITRDASFVKLVMPASTLNVTGTLVVNANIGVNQPLEGYAVANEYAEFELGSTAVMNVTGKLTVHGFVYGGKIYAKNNSTVREQMLIGNFPGGTFSSENYTKVLPFDQFGLNHIWSELHFNAGAEFIGVAYISISGYDNFVDAKIAGTDSSYMLHIESGTVVKTINEETGRMSLTLLGAKVSMYNLSVTIRVFLITTVEMTSRDKYLPIPGNLHINVNNNSTFEVKSVLKLLPGSKISVDQTSTMNIMSNGKVIILDENEYSYANNTSKDAQGYGYYGYGTNKIASYSEIPSYRFLVTLGYTRFDKGTLNNNGTVNIYGGIAGKITSSTSNGVVNIYAGYAKSVTILDLNNDAGQQNFTYILKDGRGNVINPSPGKWVLAENGDKWALPMTFKKVDNGIVVESDEIYQELSQPFVKPAWFNSSAQTYSAEVGGYLIATSEMPGASFTGSKYEEYVQFVNTTTHTITFNLNGGTADPIPAWSYVNGMLLNQDTMPIPNPSTGFFGWYTDAAGTTAWNYDTAITKDEILYAKWLVVTITATANPTKVGKGKTSTITATVKDSNGNPLSGIEVRFTGGTLNPTSAYTNASGVATSTFTMGSSNTTITVTEQSQGKTKTVTVQYDGGGSPFIYSENEEGHKILEHQPLIYDLLKTVESTTYGTIRYLQAQDGTYYIQIIEEGDSVTVIDNMKLYAIDYFDDGTVISLMHDIDGNPHTIREKIAPNSFTDQYGNSYLAEVLAQDDLYMEVNGNNPDPITYLTAVFDKPENATNVKLMLAALGNSTDNRMDHVLTRMYDTFNGSQNWWIFDEAMNYDEYHRQTILGLIDVAKIQIEVFDGEKWVSKGKLGPNMNWLEELLIVLDVSDIPGNELKIRLASPTKFEFTFGHIAVDYTDDLPMTIHELELTSAILNGTEDVKGILESIDQDYVVLHSKEGVRLGFGEIPLEEGYSRGFGVSTSGYVYAHNATLHDELEPEMKGKSFEEIKQIILQSNREELIASLPTLEEYYNIVMSSSTLTYEEIIVALYALYY